MSQPDTELSKRERQKQRREAKLVRERARQTRARRKRLLIVAAVAAVALAGVGVVIGNQVSARQQRQATIAAAEARLGEVGCTPIEEQPEMERGHLTEPDAMAASDPDVIYPDRPTTSGPHLAVVGLTGVYDKPIDERLLVHNMEHGYVVLYYDPAADAEMVQSLKGYAQERIDGPNPKVVVAPHDAMPDGTSFASVAWNFRQLCEQFDTEVTTAFLEQHYNGEAAPERLLEPHLTPGGGVIDPDAQEGPVLFPPLGDQAAGEDVEGEPGEEPAGGEPADEPQG
ncbi:MAG: DUF3105 domain-containing protein [Nitriliruptorales bacterium]|nr:DUF3105 domain-containing protein [Nitriliruptorales bacterium]